MKVDKKTNKKVCNKPYPQPYRTVAVISDKSDRAEYRRPDNGDFEVVRQNINGEFTPLHVTNQDIVPYNTYLLLRYECHICVDHMWLLQAVLYSTFVSTSCITRNVSFTRAKIGTAINDIEEYPNARYVAASEAC